MCIAVVIPTYNQRPELLRAAVESASGADEILVVDDGSDVPVLVPGTTVIRHGRNQGISAALNTGLSYTKAEWFCWLSSDDVFYRGKFGRQLEATLAAGALASFHRYDILNADGGVTGQSVAPEPWRGITEQRQKLCVNCWINGSTVMVHRSVFAEVGTFDDSFRYAQDWEMWNRIGTKYLWHFIPEVLGARREFGNLTERIAGDDDMRTVRDAEDRRVNQTYQPFGRPSGKRK